MRRRKHGETMTVPSSDRLTPSTRTARYLSVLMPAVVLLGSGALIDPGAQLERDFNTAAAAQTRLMADVAPAARPRAALAAARSPEYGTEAFWLTRAPVAEHVAHVAWSAPVAAGDRIVVNFGAYDRQVLDVISVERLEADATRIETRIETGEGKAPRFAITVRKASDPDAPPVRLTVDADGRGVTMVGHGDRTL